MCKLNLLVPARIQFPTAYYPCSTPIHFYSVHIHLHCRLLSSYSYVCMQVNGLTFTDGPSDQQLLNQGEQSYIDHFWVNCSSLHTFLYYCAIGLTANFWVKLMQIYFPFSFITHTTKLMIFDSELCFFMWVENISRAREEADRSLSDFIM